MKDLTYGRAFDKATIVWSSTMQYRSMFDVRLSMCRAWAWPEALRDLVRHEPQSAVRASELYALSPRLPIPFRRPADA